ncbi:MAG: winged helix-turn-helix transcriptional regulator [Candidatus Heimdallarchaeota archaeon]|nr:winged helix-turn-helix transcriptional regulator [Candidatus Heimdallarchaeota archaeon]
MKDSIHDESIEELKQKLDALYEQGVFLEDSDKRLKELENLEKNVEGMKKDKTIVNLLKLFKALGNQKRLLILWLIMNGVRCACEIEHILNLSQSTVSHHINALVKVGAIEAIKSGKWNLVKSPEKDISKELFLNLINNIFK